MKTLKINLKDSSYEIVIKNNLLDELPYYIEDFYHNKKVYVITDDIVADLYLEKVCNSLKKSYEVESVIIPHGEESKSLRVYEDICKKLLGFNIRRNELIIALGGGVVGDITGFVAGTIYRGVDFIQIPTTLLADLDSSIGGKTGIDFAGMKNVLGMFNQPKLVLIDPTVLKTLPKEEIVSGMGELIKHGFIHSPKLIGDLLSKAPIDEEIIYESLCCKKYFVENDVHDKSERMILNFGHTFGHVIELEKGYKHGYAVIIGMLMAMEYGIDLDITNNEVIGTLKRILNLYGIKYEYYDYKEYLNKIKFDKKNLAGEINFIFIEDIGKPVIHKIKEIEL
ncbi:MAG: 3-dehydroquinate synthase [Acholeplasmatales bacterium]|nr:3-dehydroquinate synthase [Acholeplasmatales bacterium]